MELNKIGIMIYRKFTDEYIKDNNCIFSNKYFKIRYINHDYFGIRIWKK
jgi:hypothetical protein